jgi:hypothetical protein
MFLRYPAARNTSAEQVRAYVQDLASWPAPLVRKAVEAVRRDPVRNPAYPPSCDEILKRLPTIPLSASEQRMLFQHRGLPIPIEYSPPDQREPELSEAERAAMRERIARSMAGLGLERTGAST